MQLQRHQVLASWSVLHLHLKCYGYQHVTTLHAAYSSVHDLSLNMAFCDHMLDQWQQTWASDCSRVQPAGEALEDK